MKVTRFMSRCEWDKLTSGQTISNHSKHEDKNTISVGFCFTEDEAPVAWKHLGGIVDADVCVIFDFPDGYLTESKAKYADQREGAEFGDLITKREWCCTEYSLNDCEVVCVIDPFMGEDYRRIKEIVDQHLKNIIGFLGGVECLYRI